MSPITERRRSWVGQSQQAHNARSPEEWDLTLPPKKSTKEELNSMSLQVLRALDEDWPRLKNSSLLGTWKDRDDIMRSIGPPMVLLHWVQLSELGRIPHSKEGFGVTLKEAADLAARSGKRLFIEMFSHRWVRSDHPDDEQNGKAYSLIEWAKYRWSLGMDVFFWIDYTCINQNDILPGVTMLPLYVSTCNNIVCYEMPEYESRAWCRLERLMFAAFVAPNNEFLEPDFVFDKTAERLPNGELMPSEEAHEPLPDPAEGSLSMEEDRALIADLSDLCATHWSKCWKDGLLQAVEKNAGLGKAIRELNFGKTKVRMRRFVSKRPYHLGWKQQDRSSSSTEASESSPPNSVGTLGISPKASIRSDFGVGRHASTPSTSSYWEAGIVHTTSSIASGQDPLGVFAQPSWSTAPSEKSNASWWPFCSHPSKGCCGDAGPGGQNMRHFDGISAMNADAINPYTKSGTWR
mmetsp:Transcript_7073/g.17091  ORF Transcript_7073/g.17091 Transcript_7073/m.17091 type:complete len:463 (+) Transcript_7073:110-1498(+)